MEGYILINKLKENFGVGNCKSLEGKGRKKKNRGFEVKEKEWKKIYSFYGQSQKWDKLFDSKFQRLHFL